MSNQGVFEGFEEPVHPLEATDAEVAALSKEERVERVASLIIDSREIVERAIEQYVTNDGKQLVAKVVLFSGGNDSTVLAHLFRDEATHAAHANTTIGIEQTRQFVRDTCEAWGLPLIERTPPRVEDHYRSLVLDQGFPGPGHHFKMFQRLKERALRQVRRELVTDGRSQRILFIAGRRRQESERRASVPELEREGTVVWVSPLIYWTKPDLTTYRELFDVPRNEVADLCHMSGECLCGAFAHEGEREEIAAWFPEPFEEIAELEALIADRDDIHPSRKKWGWGTDAETMAALLQEMPKSGRLCSSCDSRFQTALFELENL